MSICVLTARAFPCKHGAKYVRKYSLFFQFNCQFLEWKLKLVIASLLYWGVVTRDSCFAPHILGDRLLLSASCLAFEVSGWSICVVINVCLSYVARL